MVYFELGQANFWRGAVHCFCLVCFTFALVWLSFWFGPVYLWVSFGGVGFTFGFGWLTSWLV